jgi:hypothetical protein
MHVYSRGYAAGLILTIDDHYELGVTVPSGMAASEICTMRMLLLIALSLDCAKEVNLRSSLFFLKCPSKSSNYRSYSKCKPFPMSSCYGNRSSSAVVFLYRLSNLYFSLLKSRMVAALFSSTSFNSYSFSDFFVSS